MTEEYFDGQLIQASEEPLYGRPTDLDTQYYSAKIVGNYSQHSSKIKIIWDSSPKEIVEISREQIFVSKKRRRNANAANQSHSNNNDNEEEEEEEEVVSII